VCSSSAASTAFGVGSGNSATPSPVFHRGWILHQRHALTIVPYAGAGHYVKLIDESWKQTSPPYRTREFKIEGFARHPWKTSLETTGRKTQVCRTCRNRMIWPIRRLGETG
jgi:hypothetical protein